MKKPTDKEEIKISKKIGLTIKTLRMKEGLTQAQLAEKAGISDHKVVGFVEQAATFPSLRILVRIAKTLNVSVSKLVEDI
jgi:transcriptional regulator with XRE-family HTH domain